MKSRDQERAAEAFVESEWFSASAAGRDEFRAWIEARTNISSARRMARLLGQKAAERLLDEAYEQASARITLTIHERA